MENESIKCRFHLKMFSGKISFVDKNERKVESIIKQLLHSPLLNTKLVIANSVLLALLAIYHVVVSKEGSGIIA